MGFESFRKDPITVCSAEYRRLVSDCIRQGLITSAISDSLLRDSKPGGSVRYLKTRAFRPTGVALGCPLPSKRFQASLWRISNELNEHFQSVLRTKQPVLAMVPPECYHVTLVHADHFESHANKSLPRRLTAREKQAIEALIAKFRDIPTISFSGLILTRSGRLIVPGYPIQNTVFLLRLVLADALPTLQTNLPKTAHIKLGHLLVDLDQCRFREFSCWLQVRGRQVNANLRFSDVYTPLGRIGFCKHRLQ